MVAKYLAVFLVFFAIGFACTDPTTSVSVTHQRDTVLVIDTVQTIHVDTVLVFQVDSIYIWCWEYGHNSGTYQCTNGYRGPLK